MLKEEQRALLLLLNVDLTGRIVRMQLVLMMFQFHNSVLTSIDYFNCYLLLLKCISRRLHSLILKKNHLQK